MFTFTSLKIDQYERVNSLGVINLSKIKSTIKKASTDRASMILRKHDHNVLQSLCSIYQHFVGFFFYFIICNLYSLKMC